MRIQEAAHKILIDERKPLSSKDIAQIALNRGYVTSSSKDSVQSMAASLDKNIRDDKYNSPRLIFLYTKQGRKIGLPEMEENNKTQSQIVPNHNSIAKKKIIVELSEELVESIQLANQAKLAANYDDTIALLLQKGLSACAAEIRKRLLKQLDSI